MSLRLSCLVKIQIENGDTAICSARCGPAGSLSFGIFSLQGARVKYRSLKLSASLTTTLFLASGCSPSISGGPDLSQYQRFSKQYFASGFGSTAITEYDQSTDASEKSAIRNRIVLSALGSIDTEYGAYERSLTRESQEVPLAATLASLSLSGAGTLVASSVAKTALAAADTGLKGAKAAYDKNVLADKTVQFLQKQMRTNRNKVKSEILIKLALDTNQYPLELALIDVENYASAGTIAAGLIGIDDQTSKALLQSEDLKQTRIDVYGADDSTVVIREYLNRGGEEAQDKLRAWLKERDAQMSIWHFLNGKNAALRAAFAKTIQ